MKDRRRETRSFEEDEALSRPFDPKIARRLLRYARPYRRLVLFVVVLILVSTAAELSIPELTKIGIDRYIVVGARPADTARLEPSDREALAREAGDGLVALDGADAPSHLLAESARRRLDPALKRVLDGTGAVGAEAWSVWRGDGDPPEVAARRPELFRTFPQGLAVRDADLAALDPADRAAFKARNLEGVGAIALVMVAVLTLVFLLDFAIVFLVNEAGQKAMNDLRNEIFVHLQTMSLRFFDANPVGKLVTRGTSDVQVLTDTFSAVISHLVKDVFLLAGLVVWLLVQEWRLALVTFTVLPLLMVATFSFRRLAREAYRIVRAQVSRINAFIAENVSGMAIVQVFNRQGINRERFRAINQEHYRARLRELYIFAVFRPLVEVLSAAALGLVIWYGGGRVVQEAMSLGTLVAFLSYVRMFFRPIQDLSEKYNQLQAGMASSERIFQILDEPEEVKNPPAPLRLPAPRGAVRFENVWFAYTGEDFVLKDVSFTLEPGQNLALVGPTGSGKSSIISLLGRYWDVTRGRILFDGVDIRELDKYWLRSQLGVVMQDVFLFTGDILSNIRLRNADITDQAVAQAAEQVMANRFINRLPDRYLETVKERGASLSVGEKQLLAFARALVFDPKILVLDEATASVDSETESLIQESLETLMMGRTSIVIAHRLSTIREADDILVLQHGRIVESGSHAELLAAGGLYRLLYETQAQGA